MKGTAVFKGDIKLRDIVQEGCERFEGVVAEMSEFRDELLLQTFVDHLHLKNNRKICENKEDYSQESYLRGSDLKMIYFCLP